MSDPWGLRFTTLTSADIAVLRAMTVLETTVVGPAQLAAAVGVTEADVTRSVDRLRSDGWVRQRADGASVLESGARIWLRFDSQHGDQPHALTTLDVQIAERYLRYHLDALLTSHDHAVRWAAEHRDEIVAAIRAGSRTGARRDAVELAAAAWRVAGEIDDLGWWTALSEYGQAAAVDDSRGLLTLLVLSASVVAQASDARAAVAAESQYDHASELAAALEDHDMVVSTLTALARVAHDSGKPERTAETVLKLANAHQAAGDTAARAAALAALGALMLDHGRAQFAANYLERADDLLAALAPPPVDLRARVAELRGYALWETRNTIRARRHFRQALTMIGDNDDIRRDRLNRLVATPIESIDLPRDVTVMDWRSVLALA